MKFFSGLYSISMVSALLSATLAQAQLAPGRYRIRTDGEALRSYPSGGHQGPFQVDIIISDQFASVYEEWIVSSASTNGRYIQSSATSARAYSPATLNNQVYAASNLQTEWSIDLAGNDGTNDYYTVRIPSQDLFWSNTARSDKDNTITLKASSGTTDQRFVFEAL